MSRNIDYLINQVAGGATQRALRMLWNQLETDLAANKATFDAHTHSAQLSGSGVTACLGFAGLAIDASPEDVETTYAINYMVAGVACYKAVVSAIDISTLGFTPSTLGTLEAMAYLLTLTAGGTIDVVEGETVTGSDPALAVLPDTPAGECAFGVIRVGNIEVKAFKLGSDDLGSGSWNVTYTDLISKEPVIVSKPGSDTEDVAQTTADTFQENLET